MERKVIVVCSIVGFLGLLSAAMGFAAEATKIKASQIQFPTPTTCVYPGSPALVLGLASAIALMVAHIILNISTGCICCRRTPVQNTSSWTLALVCFVISWSTFVVAFLLLLTSAALNDERGDDAMSFGNYNCYVTKPGVFSGAAVLSLVSVILGIVYYRVVNLLKKTEVRPPSPLWAVPIAQPVNLNGIAMGRPVHPSPSSSQDAVFVHEDTYMRKQLA
ncbi:uncharacterized protein LOC124944782 [Impatiens glandulifera]|uniref:uncharacterized protein LOC124944782 n=1 Tax=Impatiens glandulifera TaxID=253017 RepID=UPI001FB06FDA|nr:uncharacterized protein LOC124944782 [Impatiens glandulifera]